MSVYSKNLSGLNQRVFVGPANVEYSAAATLTAFIDSAVEGEIGVFLDTGALRTTLLTTGLKFQIAQKRDGYVTKTPLITFGTDNLRLFRSPYLAPVRQVTSIGYNGTSGNLTLVFTGASATNTLTFGVSVRETTPGNQPFPIQEGYAMVNSSTADAYSVAASMVSQLNGDYDYQRTQPDRFVRADILMNGTRTALAANAVVTNGGYNITVTGHGLAVGAILSLANVIYKVAAVVDANTLQLDRPYGGASATITAGTTTTTASSVTYTSGTNFIGIRFTGLSDETTFKVAGSGQNTLDLVTNLTAWVFGEGTGAQIRELESVEGAIFDGVGSTINAPFKADYGQPSLFSSLTGTYDQYFLDFKPSIVPGAGLPHYVTTQIERILIAVPSTGTTPSNELQTIFGL